MDLRDYYEGKIINEYRVRNPFTLDPSFEFVGTFDYKFIFVAQQTSLKFIHVQNLLDEADKETNTNKNLKKEGNVYTLDNIDEKWERVRFSDMPVKMIEPKPNM